MDEMDASIASADPNGTSHLPRTPEVQHTSRGDQLQVASQQSDTPSTPVQTDTVQNSIANLSIMEPQSVKRAHSPEKEQPGRADAAVDGTLSAVKRMKLSHESCSCGLTHGKGLSIQSVDAKTPNWTEVIRHILKIENNDAGHKV
jgi:hypothetical protein